MAVFLNMDKSRVCLILDHGRYHLLHKELQKGDTPEERAYLLRTPRIVEKPQAGYIRRRGKRKAYFTSGQTVIDFSKYTPFEPGIITCPEGLYPMEKITVIVPPRTADLVVLFGTSIGLAKAGLDSILRRQACQKESEEKRYRVIRIISRHFGLPADQLEDDFILPNINGLGTAIGNGQYNCLAVFLNRKPALICAGMTIRKIIDQL